MDVRSAVGYLPVAEVSQARAPSARLLSVLVFLATVACFAPAVRHGFVGWDDNVALTENRRFRGLSPSHLRWMFTTVHGGDYAPLSWLTFALDHALWGMNPVGYHLTNVVLHGVNGVLAFWLIAALLRHAGMPNGIRFRLTAAAGALFFALHPLRVESVVWASERRDVLSVMFALLTVLAYLRYHASGRRPAWLLASLGFFVCSLLSKASAMTLPAVLLVLDVYPLRRLRGTGAVRAMLLEKLLYLPFSLGALLMAGYALEQAGARPLSLAQYGIGQRVAQAAFGLCFYLRKTVVPTNLSPLYPVDLHLDPTTPKYLACGTLVIAAAALLFAYRRRFPWAVAAAASYAIVLLPVLGFVQAGVPAMGDRYSYLSCVPWAVLAAAGIHVATARPGARGWVVAATMGVLAVLALLTVRQTAVWRDSITLWDQALRVDPANTAAYVTRGWAKHLAGDFRGAVADYDAALRLAASDAEAYNGRGFARYRVGDLNGALVDYSSALRLKPDFAVAWYNRGVLWQAKGNDAAAVADYTEAIRLAPRDSRPLNNRGVARASRGDFAGAIADYSAALRLEPDFLRSYVNRARARRATSDVPGAIGDVEEAIRRAPAGWSGCAGATALLAELGGPAPQRPCGTASGR